MIKTYFIRLISKIILNLGTTFNGRQHKIYAYLLNHMIKYRRNTVEKNLMNSFPSQTKKEIDANVKSYYHRLASYILQSIFAYFGKEHDIKKKLNLINSEVVEECIINNQNVILMTAHYGNWELISMLLPTYFTCPVLGVYKPLSSSTMEVEVKKWRSRFGLIMVPMKEMIYWFSNKYELPFISILVADQSPPMHESGEIVYFLNQKTVFYAGANVLKKRYHPKIFYLKTIVIEDVHHAEFIELNEDNVVMQYSSLLEKDIYDDPSLWLWSHNRWKHNI